MCTVKLAGVHCQDVGQDIDENVVEHIQEKYMFHDNFIEQLSYILTVDTSEFVFKAKQFMFSIPDVIL